MSINIVEWVMIGILGAWTIGLVATAAWIVAVYWKALNPRTRKEETVLWV